jgi:PhzF family phenazine biosynthesis protein
MKIPIYQVDAFAKELFKGNPAAVCPVSQWLPDVIMQKIGLENNLSETVFIVKEGNDYHIRWFTPLAEVNLCGHATLASAHVIFNHLNHSGSTITFHSKSGPLGVTREENGMLTLDFPANQPEKITEIPYGIHEGLGIDRSHPVYKSSFDFMVVLPTQTDVASLTPDFKVLAQSPCRGVIATAPGDEVDFVSRCFYPQTGVDEDPVTGSAHTIMVPYWAKHLGKTKMRAIQLSKRGGELEVEWKETRVLMSGHALTYLIGEIDLPDIN